MKEKIIKQPKIIIFLLILSVLLAIGSTSLKSSKNKTGNIQVSLGPVKEIIVKTPRAVAESIEVYTIPKFDFTYNYKDGVVAVKPISLLLHGGSYVVNVRYNDEAGQVLAASTGFGYEDSEKIATLLDGESVHGKDFDLIINGRHSFTVFITSTNVNEQEIIEEAGTLLKSYGIDPETIDLTIEYSRGAREDGISDPFSPVL